MSAVRLAQRGTHPTWFHLLEANNKPTGLLQLSEYCRLWDGDIDWESEDLGA